MIKHLVMYKLKENTPDNRKALVEKFYTMKGKIDLLVELNAGFDIVGSARAYDVALECVFKSKADLDAYAVHPLHLPVKEYVHSVISEAHSVDFEF